ncbi:hypothetical protein ACFQZE_03730 [Paenibacillus sp. GCM10027627]
MAHHKHGSKKQATDQSYEYRSRQAENQTAASVTKNRNQKGHVPNSPSTG